jgi:hypothetical protein
VSGFYRGRLRSCRRSSQDGEIVCRNCPVMEDHRPWLTKRKGRKSMNNEWQAYWDNFADAFVHPLKNNRLLGNFVTNQNVTGAYAESWIKSLAITMLPQFRISTGAVISYSDRRTKGLQSLPQCDLIIWNPSDLPAIFEKGDFALVPKLSARAIIEVNRRCSKLNDFREQLGRRKQCLLPQFCSNVLGVVASHNEPLFDRNDFKEGWMKDGKWRKIPVMTRLLSKESKDADTDGVFAFIDFLSHVAKQLWRTDDA